MKPWALMVAFVLVLLPSRAWAVAPVRVALVIGTNVAVDRSLATLRFADDDAARYDELFRQLGAETIVLSRLDENTSRVHPNVAARARPPTRANLDAATSELAARLTRARGEGRPSEAYVVYAGHGRAREGRGYLTLEDTWISGEELHAAVQRVGADRTHVMIDACDAYLMAYSRGPGGARRPADPFRDPSALAKDPRVGLMLSTTSERETHEWERFHSGIFSHEVRSGLHGAADADRDGIVTYRELAAFVERANAAIPNERYRPRVHAHAPVGSDVILDLRGDLSTRRIEIGRGHATHFFIEDTRGVRLVDFHFGPQGGASLLRPSPGQGLYVRRADADEELEVSAELDVVELADLTPHVPRTSPRGAEQDAFSLIFALPFDTSVVDSYAQRGPPASETAPPAPPAGSSWMKTVGIAGIAAGGAALLTGATLGVFSLVERGGDTPQESGADAQRRSERVSTLGTGAVIGLAAGTAVLAGGIVLMNPQERLPHDRWLPSPRSEPARRRGRDRPRRVLLTSVMRFLRPCEGDVRWTDMSRSSVRLTLVFVAALAALGNAYCYGAIELSNRPCPCADGFICCESTQRCAANPSACTDPGASGADAAPTAEPGATRLDGEVSQLAQDATHVYLAKPSGAIVRTQKLAGSSVEVVEPGDPVNGNSPGALAVDDAHVYWTTLGGMTSGRVLREPKSGGPVEILADDQQRPRRLALSATTVYWGTEGDDAIAGGHANGGALYAVPKAGGQPALLVDESPIGAIAVSGDWVYFARGPWSPRIGALGRVATSGGPVEWLVYNRSVLDLHVAGDTVAWSERVNAGTRIVTMSLATRAIVDHAEGEIGGVALLDGELFVTDEDRPDALVRSLGGGGTSPKVLHQTRYANDANVNTGPIVVDGSHVYWAESWWSYAAGGPHTTLFSQAR